MNDVLSVDLATLPPVAELLPHEPPMILIDALVSLEAEVLTCRAQVRGDEPFAEGGRLPALVALEYIAQTVAVHRGILGLLRGLPISRGLLVSCRALDLHVDDFAPGDALTITAVPHSEFGGFASFVGRVERGATLCAEAVVQVADMPDVSATPEEPPP